MTCQEFQALMQEPFEYDEGKTSEIIDHLSSCPACDRWMDESERLLLIPLEPIILLKQIKSGRFVRNDPSTS